MCTTNIDNIGVQGGSFLPIVFYFDKERALNNIVGIIIFLFPY